METRSRRLHDIKKDYKDLNDRIKFKEKRNSAYKNVKDYKRCDELLAGLKKQRRLLEAKEKNLMRLTTQSKWYFARKMNGRLNLHQLAVGGVFQISQNQEALHQFQFLVEANCHI